MPGMLCGSNDAGEPDMVGEGESDLYAQAKSLLKVCVSTWQDSWNASSYLCVDESMVFWTGKGDMHLTCQESQQNWG